MTLKQGLTPLGTYSEVGEIKTSVKGSRGFPHPQNVFSDVIRQVRSFVNINNNPSRNKEN